MIPPQCSLLAVCSQPCPRVQIPFTSPRAQEHWPRQPFLTHTSQPALSVYCSSSARWGRALSVQLLSLPFTKHHEQHDPD